MTGMTAILSLRGKMPVTMIVASGAFCCIVRRIACSPRVTSSATCLRVRPRLIRVADVIRAGEQHDDLRD